VRGGRAQEKEQTKEVGDRVCHVDPSCLWGVSAGGGEDGHGPLARNQQCQLWSDSAGHKTEQKRRTE